MRHPPIQNQIERCHGILAEQSDPPSRVRFVEKSWSKPWFEKHLSRDQSTDLIHVPQPDAPDKQDVEIIPGVDPSEQIQDRPQIHGVPNHSAAAKGAHRNAPGVVITKPRFRA